MGMIPHLNSRNILRNLEAQRQLREEKRKENPVKFHQQSRSRDGLISTHADNLEAAIREAIRDSCSSWNNELIPQVEDAARRITDKSRRSPEALEEDLKLSAYSNVPDDLGTSASGTSWSELVEAVQELRDAWKDRENSSGQAAPGSSGEGESQVVSKISSQVARKVASRLRDMIPPSGAASSPPERREDSRITGDEIGDEITEVIHQITGSRRL